MKIRNVLLLALLAAFSMARAEGEHWEWNAFQYPDNAIFVSVITINGVEQRTEDLEIGAFHDDVCRGSIKCEYDARKDRYFAFLTVNGVNGMEMTFRLWDHSTQSELDVTCDYTYTFEGDGSYGIPRDPFIFPFTANADGVVFDGGSTVYWSGAGNWSGNALPGVYDDVTISANCVLDRDATVANLTVANGKTLTIQSGMTLTVTGTLTNTAVTGWGIKDGAQLINASPNVGATAEKNVRAYSDSNPAGWYTIASPVDAMPIEGSDFLTVSYDLYRYEESNTNQDEWENYKAGHEDFTTFENGRGYLYANSNSFSPAFKGVLNVAEVTRTLTYTERPDDLSGFNLIGNPFPHVIYKGRGGAINNANLASGYYTLTNEGAWHVHTYDDAIQPGQGILVKTVANIDLTISKSNAPATFESGNAKAAVDRMEMTVTGRGGEDRCFAYFCPGIGLDKIDSMDAAVPNLCIRDNEKNYAIAHIDSQAESLDLMLSTNQSERLVLTVKTKNYDFDYLHLIDRITGDDIDLLEQPEYSFQATGEESEPRFMIVFRQTTGVEENQQQSFCFVKDKMLCFNTEGQGQLTITDALGRVVKSVDRKGNAIPIHDLQAGIYIVRLVCGNVVMTQKVIMQ